MVKKFFKIVPKPSYLSCFVVRYSTIFEIMFVDDNDVTGNVNGIQVKRTLFH